MANVATPLPLSDAVPRTVLESLKVTLPDGTAMLLTVAVNVTVSPKFEGLFDDVTVVVVGQFSVHTIPPAPTNIKSTLEMPRLLLLSAVLNSMQLVPG